MSIVILAGLFNHQLTHRFILNFALLTAKVHVNTLFWIPVVGGAECISYSPVISVVLTDGI